jgi:hypothetical protein
MLAADRRRQFALRVLVAMLSTIAVAVIAAFLPRWWPGVSGRDFRPWGVAMAAFIFGLAIFFRAVLKWEGGVFGASLLGVEIFTLCVISHFTGFVWLEVLDPFNLRWLAVMNVFFAAPWAIGFFVGSLILRVRRQADGRW